MNFYKGHVSKAGAKVPPLSLIPFILGGRGPTISGRRRVHGYVPVALLRKGNMNAISKNGRVNIMSSFQGPNCQTVP